MSFARPSGFRNEMDPIAVRFPMENGMRVTEKTASKAGAKRGKARASKVATAAREQRPTKAKGFTTSFVVDQSPRDVFDAINNVRGWWSGNIQGSTDKLGAEFTYRYKDLHHSTQRITELVPGKKVVWHVLDARLNFVTDKTEWNGTDIVFEIARKGDKTQLRFTHVGLLQAFECYGDCSGAWGFYVNDSLRRLITTGKGEPNTKEG
jgi:Activator of Hsp90 ATPase homolog 1-like protein